MTIGIASDHKGFELKQELTNYLKEKGYTINDYGVDNSASADYPIYAFKVGEAVRDSKVNLGILICGTGIGMSIAANKVKKVRCAKVDTEKDAYYARFHNNANVLALACDLENIYKIVDTFLTTPFSNEERHMRRIELIDKYDA